jgi:hypothetical protein
LTIVGCFTAHDREVTLAEIAQRTGFYKSTILRLCGSLEKSGHVTRLNDGRFVLGGALFRIGQIYQRSFNPADYVLPILQQLTRNTGQSSSLWIKEGDFRVCLFRVEALEDVRDLSARAVSAGRSSAVDRHPPFSWRSRAPGGRHLQARARPVSQFRLANSCRSLPRFRRRCGPGASLPARSASAAFAASLPDRQWQS